VAPSCEDHWNLVCEEEEEEEEKKKKKSIF
jgi:hypothetical protein